SLLTFWNPPTTAQLTVESVPPNAAEGKDVLLRVHSLPGDLLGCNWFRRETVNTSRQILSYVVDTQVTIPGPAHSGRETIYPNGSLLPQSISQVVCGTWGTAEEGQRPQGGTEQRGAPGVSSSTKNQAQGAFSCGDEQTRCHLIGQLLQTRLRWQSSPPWAALEIGLIPDVLLLVQLGVRKRTCLLLLTLHLKPAQGTIQGNVLSVVCTAELPKPNITSNNSDPVENADSVVLTCEPQTRSTSFLWSVNRKSLPASTRLELSLDNRTLTIHRVTRNDTGPYECETRNPVSAGHSDPFTLNVLYGPDAPTISPSDSQYRPGASLRLSCHAASNPPARYSWLINGRPQPSTQELFIPNLTANDSGAYTCIASNSGTRLNKTTVQTITVSGKWIPGASAL
ncbi:hypothetical protein PANDA_022225, partial [Ailuropoda melanoleuca]